MDHHVRPFKQLEQDLLPALRAHIQTDGALIPVDAREVCRQAVFERRAPIAHFGAMVQ